MWTEHSQRAAQQSYRGKNRKKENGKRKNLCLLPNFSFFFLLAGNILIRRIVYWDENPEKAHYFFNRQYGHVRSAVYNFCDSSGDTKAFYGSLADRWCTWQALSLCNKLVACLTDVSLAVSVWSPVLIAEDQFRLWHFPSGLSYRIQRLFFTS